LVRVLECFSREHPRVRFHVVPVFQPTVEFPELLERKIDLVFARLARDPVRGRLTEELNAEVLFRDRYTLVVGENSKWRDAGASRLLARGRAAFDELRQGIREIEFIADPEAGELRIGCPESIAARRFDR
jgi:DNA-binding transcriptional LysR family regulator